MSIFNASRLLGKTVLITGASGGIGAVSGDALGLPDQLELIYSFKATAVLFAKVHCLGHTMDIHAQY